MKKKSSEISLKSIYNTIDENTIVRNNRDATTHARNKTSKHIEKITISPRKSANTSKKLSRFRFHDEKLQKSKIYYKKLIKLRARFVHTRAASTCTTKTLAGSSLGRPVSTSRRSVPLYRPVLLKRTPLLWWNRRGCVCELHEPAVLKRRAINQKQRGACGGCKCIAARGWKCDGRAYRFTGVSHGEGSLGLVTENSVLIIRGCAESKHAVFVWDDLGISIRKLCHLFSNRSHFIWFVQ